MGDSQQIKEEILAALAHPEAEEGLYLKNLNVLHEEEERPRVQGTQLEILDCLKELIDEGKIRTNDEGEEVIFLLAKN